MIRTGVQVDEFAKFFVFLICSRCRTDWVLVQISIAPEDPVS